MAIFLKGVRDSRLFLSVYIYASTSSRLFDLGGEWHKDQRLRVESINRWLCLKTPL
jgi:hypothetical protein